MSRAQEATAANTAATQNAGYYTNAQNSYATASTEAANNEKDVGAYAAKNPYGQGGQAQTVTNQQLTDTADATANAAATTLQGQALRTGENVDAAVAGTEAAQQAAQRTLGSQQAAATAARIASGAKYDESVLQAGNQVEGQEAQLTGQQIQGANAAAGNQGKDAETPSWTDEFGNALAGTLGGKGFSASYRRG